MRPRRTDESQPAFVDRGSDLAIGQRPLRAAADDNSVFHFYVGDGLQPVGSAGPKAGRYEEMRRALVHPIGMRQA